MNDSSRQPLKGRAPIKPSKGIVTGKQAIKGKEAQLTNEQVEDGNKTLGLRRPPPLYQYEVSDEEESRKGAFKGMSAKAKTRHILKRWRTVYNDSLSVAVVLRLKDVVTTKIELFGR